MAGSSVYRVQAGRFQLLAFEYTESNAGSRGRRIERFRWGTLL